MEKQKEQAEREQKQKQGGKWKEKQPALFEIRTDLAVEEQESFPGDGGEITGVSLKEWCCGSGRIRLTEVRILDSHGEKAMGKPKGRYITLEAGQMTASDEAYQEEVAGELSVQLKTMIEAFRENGMIPQNKKLHVLVVGLGNQLVTPDALGPGVLGNLRVTRHLQYQYGEEFCRKHKLPLISGIAPGVMAQTGMETAEILRGIIEETSPDLLIAIDALAARSIRRLGTTIQLTDTGIHPGSGVGNHRHSLTIESMGVPVIAIGVPTVVGAAAIVHDTVSALIQALGSHSHTKAAARMVEQMNPDEQYQLISELLEPEFGSLYVTPPDIDQTIKNLSFTISEGIHQTFFEAPVI